MSEKIRVYVRMASGLELTDSITEDKLIQLEKNINDGEPCRYIYFAKNNLRSELIESYEIVPKRIYKD